MPRNKQKKGPKLSRGMNREPSGEILYKGTMLLNPTLAIGANVIPLTPQTINPLLTNMSDTFQEYRFEKCRFILYPETSNTYAACYGNEVTDTPSTTILSALQYPKSQLITDGTFTTKVLDVGRQFLLGQSPLKWWRTRTSTAGTPTSDTWDNIQGVLNVVTAAVETVFILVKYVIRFANAMGPTQTPEPYKRPSLIANCRHLPVIDMYLPGHQYPFPEHLDVDAEFLRSARLFHKQTPLLNEFKRLQVLCSKGEEYSTDETASKPPREDHTYPTHPGYDPVKLDGKEVPRQFDWRSNPPLSKTPEAVFFNRTPREAMPIDRRN